VSRRGAVIAMVLAVAVGVGITIFVATRDDDSRPAVARDRPVTSGSSSPSTAPAPPSTTTIPTTTSTTPSPLGALAGHTIVVDAGHDGGNYQHAAEINRPIFIGTQNRACDTTGTSTYDGYTEAEYTLDVALRLRDVLSAAGAKVVMVRTTNDGWGPCIDERAYIGNRAGAEAGISIHADGGPDGGRGFHVNTPANIPGYTDDIYAASSRLGVELRDAYRTTGMPTATYIGSDGLLERRDFGGLNLSDVPKVLFETGNMRNGTDAVLLEDPAFRQRAAEALAAGMAAYFSAG
jgi:N-acetylmuramoyl-L-alanine amidase